MLIHNEIDIVNQFTSDYNLPKLSLEALIILAQRTSVVYNLDKRARNITVDEIFFYIKAFLSTKFGAKTLEKL